MTHAVLLLLALAAPAPPPIDDPPPVPVAAPVEAPPYPALPVPPSAPPPRNDTCDGRKPDPGFSVPIEWQRTLTGRVAQLQAYPPQAMAEEQSGTVMVGLIVLRDGRLEKASIRRSSGHEILDAAALSTVWKAQPFPALPCVAPSRVHFSLPVRFLLAEDEAPARKSD